MKKTFRLRLRQQSEYKTPLIVDWPNSKYTIEVSTNYELQIVPKKRIRCLPFLLIQVLSRFFPRKQSMKGQQHAGWQAAVSRRSLVVD